MPDEPTAKVTNEVEPQLEPVKADPEPKIESVDELKLKVDELTRKLTNKDEEAKRVHNKLEKFEKEEEARKQAELSEIEKLTLRAEKAEKEAVEIRLNLTKREIAAKFDLPQILADRIQGATPEDMEQDAQKLAEQLPKPKANILPTNPGSGLNGVETDAQRYARLFGNQNN